MAKHTHEKRLNIITSNPLALLMEMEIYTAATEKSMENPKKPETTST